MHSPAAQNGKAPTRALLTEFDRWHRLILGVPAVIRGGKDAKLIAGLFKSHGETEVRELIAAFFESRDPFIRQAGYSVGVFISQAPKLIARRHPPVKLERRDWREDCERLHGGRCGSAFFHQAKVDYDADGEA